MNRVLVILLVVSPSLGLIHNLHILKDRRGGFFIENFGFAAGGHLELDVSNFRVLVNQEGQEPRNDYQVAFVIRRTNTDSSEFLNEKVDECYIATAENDKNVPQEYWAVRMGNRYNWTKLVWQHDISDDQEGLYNIYFVNCEPDTGVNFDVQITAYNMGPDGPDYLSLSETHLSAVYLAFFGVYMVCAITWVVVMRKTSTLVYKIHYIMLVLVLLKGFSLAAAAIRFHFMKLTGHGSGGWNAVFYIFAFAKGILLFGVIVLIGTGWAFVKPFLSDKDKRILMVVIPLQVVANVALVIVDEMAPGSQDWVAWYDVLRLVDIICCGAVMFPIIWSIKHLKEAAATDGKAARNMEKLKLFRQFYIMVVAWIYFTRIIVYLLVATVPFRYVWLSEFFYELSTLCFYIVSGYQFRPVSNNPYLNVADDESNVIEMGTAINDGDRDETTTTPTAAPVSA